MEITPRHYFLLRRLKEARDKHFKGRKVTMLDIGCSDGGFMRIVKDNIPGVEGLDGVDIPSQWLKVDNVRAIGNLYVQSLEEGTGDLPLGHYDIITCWEVIEHAENVHLFLRNVRKLLKPGGLLLLSTPNLLGLSRFIKGKSWVGVAEKDHKYLFDRLSLSMAFELAGFERVEIKGYILTRAGKSLDALNRALTRLPGGGTLIAKAFRGE